MTTIKKIGEMLRNKFAEFAQHLGYKPNEIRAYQATYFLKDCPHVIVSVHPSAKPLELQDGSTFVEFNGLEFTIEVEPWQDYQAHKNLLMNCSPQN